MQTALKIADSLISALTTEL